MDNVYKVYISAIVSAAVIIAMLIIGAISVRQATLQARVEISKLKCK